MSSNPNQSPQTTPEDEELEELLASTDRVLEMTRQDREARKPETQATQFTSPPPAEAELAEQEQAYEATYEIEAAKSTAQYPDEIRTKLVKRGLFPGLTNPADAETQEQLRLAEARAAAPPSEPKKAKRRPASARTNPALSPGIRKKPGYDKQQEPSSDRLF